MELASSAKGRGNIKYEAVSKRCFSEMLKLESYFWVVTIMYCEYHDRQCLLNSIHDVRYFMVKILQGTFSAFAKNSKKM